MPKIKRKPMNNFEWNLRLKYMDIKNERKGIQQITN